MNTKSKLVLPVAVLTAAALGVIGTAAINSFQVNAATADTSTTQSTSTADTETPRDPALGGHIGTNGTKEELLTGDTAEKVKAAALVAVPGATVQRVENDAEGAAYEAHMTKSDGTRVTVKLDASFKVTSTESGHGNH